MYPLDHIHQVIISNNTGHLDIVDEDHCYALPHTPLLDLRPAWPVEGWGEPDIDEVVTYLQRVYSKREEAKAKVSRL
jgi:hypothetical protein